MKPYTKVFLQRLAGYMIYIFGVSAIFMVIEKGEKAQDPFLAIKGTYYYLKTPDTFENLTEKDFTNIVLHAAKGVCKKPKQPWSYRDCYRYGIHLVTTVGYGTITPSTELGQLVTVLYALIGIPLAMLTMRAMAFHHNQMISKVLSKCFTKDTSKQTEVKIVMLNVTVTLLFLFISAGLSTSIDKYTYGQGLYAWFITMTTIGLGDFVPEKTDDSYTLLIGLCFMSATIDSLVTYWESSDISLTNCLKGCLCCFSAKTHSRDDGDEDQTKGESNGAATKNVGTQTNGMMNYGLSNDTATVF